MPWELSWNIRPLKNIFENNKKPNFSIGWRAKKELVTSLSTEIQEYAFFHLCTKKNLKLEKERSKKNLKTKTKKSKSLKNKLLDYSILICLWY